MANHPVNGQHILDRVRPLTDQSTSRRYTIFFLYDKHSKELSELVDKSTDGSRSHRQPFTRRTSP